MQLVGGDTTVNSAINIGTIFLTACTGYYFGRDLPLRTYTDTDIKPSQPERGAG